MFFPGAASFVFSCLRPDVERRLKVAECSHNGCVRISEELETVLVFDLVEGLGRSRPDPPAVSDPSPNDSALLHYGNIINQGVNFLRRDKNKAQGQGVNQFEAGVKQGPKLCEGKSLSSKDAWSPPAVEKEDDSDIDPDVDPDCGVEKRYAEVLKEYVQVLGAQLKPVVSSLPTKPTIASAGSSRDNEPPPEPIGGNDPGNVEPPPKPIEGEDRGPTRRLRGPRQFVQEPFGQFSLAPVTRYIDGQRIQIGWGANCGKHHNHDDGPGDRCQKQITYGKDGPNQLTDQECKRLAKAWLMLGVGAAWANIENARWYHVHKVNPKREAPASWTHEELDRIVPAS